MEDIILHTGQHYDPGLSDIFFDELQIPRPTVHLDVGSGSHGAQTARMLEQIESALLEYKPKMVVVYGDTNSTLAGALAATKLHIPVAHIEAGLRSFDKTMPEEVNRIVSDHVSDLLFAPTQTAIDNLKTENLADKSQLVGDVMLDAVTFNRGLAAERSQILSSLRLDAGQYAVATLHRAGNTDSNRLLQLLDSLNRVADESLPVIFPVHPRTRAKIAADCPGWKAAGNFRLIDPVGYLDMLQLVGSSRLVLTDSGGLQKEAFFLDRPCITLRDETEWPETVTAGGNVLVGADREKLLAAVAAALASGGSGGESVFSVESGFGDGNASGLIVKGIADFARDHC